jgi:hypothetical protein
MGLETALKLDVMVGLHVQALHVEEVAGRKTP